MVLREPPPRYECSCIIYVPMVQGGFEGGGGGGGGASHVAYTDHVNASRGIVVFYGETRDPTFLHSDSCNRISPDKRRDPRSSLLSSLSGELEKSWILDRDYYPCKKNMNWEI